MRPYSGYQPYESVEKATPRSSNAETDSEDQRPVATECGPDSEWHHCNAREMQDSPRLDIWSGLLLELK